ncbi:hypothetical protein HII36_34520 [Nonomuraea sp. NN258]|uniref:hypothetical protein n=1 Tax=Nonomuraea antri TaxID=2730852 RepID=UPI00156A4817|nr:hypothetical protein [Nonomuraea antri]NRQ36916.1 hypothetical protein [Nonomuraea antri]
MAAGSRVRIRRYLVFVVVVLLVVVVLAVGFLGWDRGRDVPAVSSPPDGPWPDTARSTVLVCDARFEGTTCAVKPDRRRIEQALRELPGAVSVRLRSGRERAAEALRNDQDMSPHMAWPDQYVVEFGPGMDVVALRRRLAAIPGLSNPRVERTSFWHDKADITILVCPPKENNAGPCNDRGQVTGAERAIIEEKLRSLPGVEEIYFEPVMHRREVIARMERCPRLRADRIGAAYHLKLESGGSFAALWPDLQGLPAVFYVFDTHEPGISDSNQVEGNRNC